jgi:GNAT superfamily N-acetyltransferase
MTLTIQPAAPADAARLVQVQVAAFHNDSVFYPGVALGGPPGYESVAVMLEKIELDDAYTFRWEGQIIGGMVIFKHTPQRHHLDVIFIDPAYHNQGIGSQAMTFLEQTYPAVQVWTLNTPQYATRNQHFYEKFGYRKVGVSEIGGLPLIDYEKRR